MHPYLKLIRPINCFMGCLGVFIGAVVGVGLSVTRYLQDITLEMFIVFIFMAGANSLNDYYDRKTDKINHPDRPIPSGKIKPGTALHFGVGALGLSVILGYFINFTSFFIVCNATLLIFLYELEYKNKGLIGNLIISVLVALIFIYGGAVVLSYKLNIFLAVMAFFATLGREIVKDIQDIKGDVDRFTLPKKIGVPQAGFIAAVMVIIAICISPLPFFSSAFSLLNFDHAVGYQYLIFVLIADLVFINSIATIKINPGEASRLLKIGMAVALIAFLIGAIF
ncbi:MAG: UbiA family prenyltransferase [Thermoplasmata archaeon]|nr:MAG: UbiA family prenyltransferase [Thermoplasmata archaeon]